MQGLRKMIVIIAGAIGMMLVASTLSQACECVGDSQRQAFRKARMVFVGTVLGPAQGGVPTQAETEQGFCMRRVYMSVVTLFKGNHVPEVSVEQCGFLGCYPFELGMGQSYLVYAYGASLRVMTSACTRARRVDIERDAELKAELTDLGSRKWRLASRLGRFGAAISRLDGGVELAACTVAANYAARAREELQGGTLTMS